MKCRLPLNRVQKKKSLTEVPPPSPSLPTSETRENFWYLGLDLGTTSIAAVLFNPVTAQLYPLSWPQAKPPMGTLVPQVHNFKPYLNTAIPYLSPQTQEWEPKLQRSLERQMSLADVQQAIIDRLLPLTQAAADSGGCRAEGLDGETLSQVMQQLTGVVVSYPVGASDAYCFNLREIVLRANLVPYPEQIFFLEEAIAALLTELHQSAMTPAESESDPFASPTADTKLTGAVLVISAGATSTDLLLVDLPANSTNLQREDLFVRRFSYGGNALDQDILCQLMHPLRANWPELPQLPTPLAGEPDLEVRYQLQQYLSEREAGQQLLARAKHLKAYLTQGDTVFEWQGNQYRVRQSDFHNWVIAPLLQQIHREISLLLLQSGLRLGSIRRVICTGGTASIPAIAQGLQEKFPAAQMIQDPGLEDGTSPASHQRLSQGLSLLPLFPEVLERVRHQYSELFLLRELLKALLNQPEQPLSSSRILQLLKEQGIMTDLCETEILNLLEGQIPRGLVPGRASAMLFASESPSSPQELAQLAAPLFSRLDSQLFQVVPKQRDRLWAYFQIILANTHQKLADPLAVNLPPLQQPSDPIL